MVARMFSSLTPSSVRPRAPLYRTGMDVPGCMRLAPTQFARAAASTSDMRRCAAMVVWYRRAEWPDIFDAICGERHAGACWYHWDKKARYCWYVIAFGSTWNADPPLSRSIAGILKSGSLPTWLR